MSWIAGRCTGDARRGLEKSRRNPFVFSLVSAPFHSHFHFDVFSGAPSFGVFARTTSHCLFSIALCAKTFLLLLLRQRRFRNVAPRDARCKRAAHKTANAATAELTTTGGKKKERNDTKYTGWDETTELDRRCFFSSLDFHLLHPFKRKRISSVSYTLRCKLNYNLCVFLSFFSAHFPRRMTSSSTFFFVFFSFIFSPGSSFRP